jgi:hypothetical protein
MGLMAVLPPLASAPPGWRRGVAVVVGVVMVALTVPLWMLGLPPGVAMTAGAIAAVAVAVRAVLGPRISAPSS